jgi:hypothetical protein
MDSGLALRAPRNDRLPMLRRPMRRALKISNARGCDKSANQAQ